MTLDDDAAADAGDAQGAVELRRIWDELEAIAERVDARAQCRGPCAETNEGASPAGPA